MAVVGCGVEGKGVGGGVGCVLGNAVGSAEGQGVGGIVGCALGHAVGSADGVCVGSGVGAYVTSCTPAPATTAKPEHDDEPMQPSWIRYVCVTVPAGTVYCTCAQKSLPDMHAAGGRLLVPVSSYTTSTPPGVYTRSVVWPEHIAPENIAPHMDTVKVCPALAVTPHSAKFLTSALVLEVR